MYFRTTAQLQLELGNLPFVLKIDRCKNGDFRIAVDSKFPNGEHLDIFLSQTKGCYLLHDDGRIYEYFQEIGRKFPTEEDGVKIEFIKSAHGVLVTSNGFEQVEKSDYGLGKALMRYAQAFDIFFYANLEPCKHPEPSLTGFCDDCGTWIALDNEEAKTKEKLRETILLVCEKSSNDPNFDLEKLKTIIFQVDKLAYLRTEKTITGSVYIAEKR